MPSWLCAVGGLRVELDGVARGRLGARLVAGRLQRRGQHDVRVRLLRRQPAGLERQGARLIRPLEPEQRERQQAEAPLALGVGADGAARGLLGLVGCLEPQVGEREQAERVRVRRVGGDRAVQVRERGLRPPEVEERGAALRRLAHTSLWVRM